MARKNSVLVGALAGAGLVWGGMQVVRWRRRIDLDGRVVVITGGSTGHGLIAARQAAREGARLVIAARDADELAAARAALEEEEGAAAVLDVPTDVADKDQCERLIQQALERFGRVDVLVNNAGVIQFGPWESLTREDFETLMAINFWGALNCSLAVIPAMRRQGFGRIANVVSLGGLLAAPHLATYTASKFALTGLTRSMRVELAHDNILVTGLYPTTMRTGGHTHAIMKGDHEAEYRLFAASDTLPLVSVSAERAARTMWNAVKHGDAEARIGFPTEVFARLSALFPNLSAEIVTLTRGLFPSSPGGVTEGVAGGRLEGPMIDWFNRQVPEAGRPG